MIKYSICKEKKLKWNLYINNSTGGFCGEMGQWVGRNIVNVLRLVKRIFEDIFGEEMVNQHCELAVMYSSDGPQTFRENNIIFLNTTGTFYIQQIYQFSHELCHMMITNSVSEEFRWLEETFCELMSWYVLQIVYNERIDNPIDELKPIYEWIPEYILTCMGQRADIKNISVASFISQNYSYFQDNCYVRSMNAVVAYELFPLFIRNPQLWRCVPNMDQLDGTESLQNALQKICTQASIPEDISQKLVWRLCG